MKKNKSVSVEFKPKLDDILEVKMISPRKYKLIPGYLGEEGKPVINKKFIKNLIDWAKKEKQLSPTIEGYFILLAEYRDINEEMKKYALKQKVLINPKRADCIKYIPRSTYAADHRFDKKEKGWIIIEKDEKFWAKHEKKYQKWLRSNPQ